MVISKSLDFWLTVTSLWYFYLSIHKVTENRSMMKFVSQKHLTLKEV